MERRQHQRRRARHADVRPAQAGARSAAGPQARRAEGEGGERHRRAALEARGDGQDQEAVRRRDEAVLRRAVEAPAAAAVRAGQGADRPVHGAAGEQGKYWEMHSKLFASQKALGVPALKGYAKELALDQGKFDKCLDSGEKAKVVEANKQAGAKVGVTGTPAFFINGYQLTGAQPIEEFKIIIDQELARK